MKRVAERDKEIIFTSRQSLRKRGVEDAWLDEFYEDEEEWLTKQEEIKKNAREMEIGRNLKLFFQKREEAKK